jgi:hypothetical protein
MYLTLPWAAVTGQASPRNTAVLAAFFLGAVLGVVTSGRYAKHRHISALSGARVACRGAQVELDRARLIANHIDGLQQGILRDAEFRRPPRYVPRLGCVYHIPFVTH